MALVLIRPLFLKRLKKNNGLACENVCLDMILVFIIIYLWEQAFWFAYLCKNE